MLELKNLLAPNDNTNSPAFFSFPGRMFHPLHQNVSVNLPVFIQLEAFQLYQAVGNHVRRNACFQPGAQIPLRCAARVKSINTAVFLIKQTAGASHALIPHHCRFNLAELDLMSHAFNLRIGTSGEIEKSVLSNPAQITGQIGPLSIDVYKAFCRQVFPPVIAVREGSLPLTQICPLTPGSLIF